MHKYLIIGMPTVGKTTAISKLNCRVWDSDHLYDLVSSIYKDHYNSYALEDSFIKTSFELVHSEIIKEEYDIVLHSIVGEKYYDEYNRFIKAGYQLIFVYRELDSYINLSKIRAENSDSNFVPLQYEAEQGIKLIKKTAKKFNAPIYELKNDEYLFENVISKLNIRSNNQFIKTNFNAHTSHCENSEIILQRMIEKAINEGFSEFGITKYISNKKDFESLYDEHKKLLNEYEKIKEKYKKEINLYFGWQSEYFPKLNDYLKKLNSNQKINYLILNSFDFEKNKELTEEEIWLNKEMIIKGLNTKIFSCLSHLYSFFKKSEKLNKNSINYIKEIIEICIELDIAIEFSVEEFIYYYKENLNNNNDYQQLTNSFWDIVSKSEVKIIIGYNVHKYSSLNNIWTLRINEYIDILNIRKNIIYLPSNIKKDISDKNYFK